MPSEWQHSNNAIYSRLSKLLSLDNTGCDYCEFLIQFWYKSLTRVLARSRARSLPPSIPRLFDRWFDRSRNCSIDRKSVVWRQYIQSSVVHVNSSLFRVLSLCFSCTPSVDNFMFGVSSLELLFPSSKALIFSLLPLTCNLQSVVFNLPWSHSAFSLYCLVVAIRPSIYMRCYSIFDTPKTLLTASKSSPKTTQNLHAASKHVQDRFLNAPKRPHES